MTPAGPSPRPRTKTGGDAALPQLPRRQHLNHLEPQLLTPHGPGNGTPFAAFESATPVPDVATPESTVELPAVPPDAPTGPFPVTPPLAPGYRAAAFLEGRRRAAETVTPSSPLRAPRTGPGPGPRPRRPHGRDQASGPAGS